MKVGGLRWHNVDEDPNDVEVQSKVSTDKGLIDEASSKLSGEKGAKLRVELIVDVLFL